MIGTPVIYYIWYGNWNQTNGTDTASGQQILRDLANTIGGSPHFQINTTYSITGTSITGNVTFGGETTDSYSQGSSLSDAGVQTVVNNAINAGRLPYNANGIYFVLSSSDVAESSGFCSQYCGWHTTGTLTRARCAGRLSAMRPAASTPARRRPSGRMATRVWTAWLQCWCMNWKKPRLILI